ncbi:hypothetical protein VTP01DRAFT_1295 [Rhizomucor pusillus]|uniref:uncharacterized protein n=1 Tax=Rhizomucor pusillus TaxID=4840 RepID=UPI003741F0A5
MEEIDAAAQCARFEEACSDFQVPATRAAAEQVLTSFRQIPKVLPLCQYILDHAQSPMAQFQIAAAISDVAIRDYTLYQTADLIQLKNHLIGFCLKHANLMKYVRDQLLKAAALITKRSLFDMPDTEKESVYSSIKELLLMQGHNTVIGIAFANALTDQFSSTKASVVGLSWEFHHKCKVFFESNISLPLFQECMTLLHAFVSQTQSLPVPPPPILVELIALLEKLMQWPFETTDNNTLPRTFQKDKDIDDDFDKTDGPGTSARSFTVFPKSWRLLLTNHDVLWLFFMVYSLVQTDDVLGHRCRQCLVQLAGFKNDYFDNDVNAIREYARTMVIGALKMMKDLQNVGNDPEAMSEHGPHLLGAIQIVRRLLENVSLSAFCATAEFFEFLNCFGKLAIACLRATAADVDEGWIGEASDECLATWVTLAQIVQPPDGGRSDYAKTDLNQADINTLALFVKSVAIQIIEVYIDTKLEQTKKDLAEEDDDEVNNGFKDWDTYADQLTCIGTLGRLDPAKCLLHLHQLLVDRFDRLKRYFTTNVADSDQYLIYLQEHLHWIILIIAHVLADAGDGEQPMVPDSLMFLSGSQPPEQDQVTSISRQILEIFRFLSSFGPNTVEASNCSPQVAETLIWFMERWSKSYLLINENEYGYISPNIANAFGRPGPSDGEGLHIINFFIEQIQANFILWNADPDVLLQIIRWLNTCGTSINLKMGFLESSKFPDLVKFVTENLEQLPEVVHNSLIQTITTISSGAADAHVRDKYLQLIFGMIEKRLGSVLHHPEFMQNFQRVDMMNNVINALEMFDGLALASQFNNTQSIFKFSSRFFESFLQLMNMYKNVSELQLLLLQLFADLAGRLDFSLLDPSQKQMLFQIVIEILKVYGDSNQGKKRLHSQEEEADRPYPDIATSLSLLTNIMASEFEDFNRTENVTPTPPGSADVADVVLYGVNVIIPMVNMEMLQIPSICQQYIKLISHLIEFFPDKLAGLPADLFNNLMASLDFGINHAINDVNILALQAIAPLALWTHNQMLSNVNVDFLKPALDRFLQQLIDILLFRSLDTSVVNAASEALLCLICAERETYFNLVNQVISQQPGDIRGRVLHAFQRLDAATPQQLPGVLPPSRNVAGFKEALYAFLMDVRAVLRVK